jgi:hypothetical protein
VEAITQEFIAVTVVMTGKLSNRSMKPTKVTLTPRIFGDEDRECYYVTTDYGPSDDDHPEIGLRTRDRSKKLSVRLRPRLSSRR